MPIELLTCWEYLAKFVHAVDVEVLMACSGLIEDQKKAPIESMRIESAFPYACVDSGEREAVIHDVARYMRSLCKPDAGR